MSEPTCADCDVAMELGFVPDLSSGAVQQMCWHRGDADPFRLLGRKLGVKVDQKELVPIIAYRCNNCGVLRFYAKVPHKE